MMAFTFRGLLLCLALASSGCAGGGTTALPSGTPNAAPDALARTADASSPGVVYFAFPDRIDVYRKDATGSPVPLRTITGQGQISSIAVDRFGNVFVGDAASWTVRELGPHAQGNATPLRVFTAADSDPSPAQRGIAALGVRWDGGVAVLALRSGASSASSVFGVFEPGDHAFQVIKPLPGQRGLDLGVDGSGDVLVGYQDSVSNGGGAEATVERFSPHPYGFHDDGTIVAVGYATQGFALATSPFNVLQINEFRYVSSADPAPALVADLGDVLRSPHLAFDAEGRLFEVSHGPNTLAAIAAVFAKNPVNGQPLRTFSVQRENGFAPIGIAVSD